MNAHSTHKWLVWLSVVILLLLSATGYSLTSRTDIHRARRRSLP
jgi:hypothetical protein